MINFFLPGESIDSDCKSILFIVIEKRSSVFIRDSCMIFLCKKTRKLRLAVAPVQKDGKSPKNRLTLFEVIESRTSFEIMAVMY